MVTSSTPLVERLDWDSSSSVARSDAPAWKARCEPGRAPRVRCACRGLACVYFAAAARTSRRCRGEQLAATRRRPGRARAAGGGRLPARRRTPSTASSRARRRISRTSKRSRPTSRARAATLPIRISGATRPSVSTVRGSATVNGYVDAVLVAHGRDGDVLGFVCPKMHGELCDLQLVGVASAQRQRKVGRGLVSAGIAWGASTARRVCRSSPRGATCRRSASISSSAFSPPRSSCSITCG